MQQTIGTTPELLGSGRPRVVQNLGAGDLYLGLDDEVSTSTGFRLEAGESLELGRVHQAVFAVASASTDVRFLEL